MEDQNNKIPKGYRLRVSTHNLLRQLVLSTGSNYDTIISTACMLLEKEIKYMMQSEQGVGGMYLQNIGNNHQK